MSPFQASAPLLVLGRNTDQGNNGNSFWAKSAINEVAERWVTTVKNMLRTLGPTLFNVINHLELAGNWKANPGLSLFRLTGVLKYTSTTQHQYIKKVIPPQI